MLSEIAQILESAPQTKCVELGTGVIERTPEVFARWFSGKSALVVADPTTFAVAGERVLAGLRSAGTQEEDAFVFTDASFYAEDKFVSALEEKLRARPYAIPVAVGSGTINDVTKLAAHRVERSCMTVATAASMDGYTAFGASITRNGSKETFACNAPVAVVADLDIISSAPLELNAAGYADLLAKITAGADWILADALGVESIHKPAWELVQGNLHRALAAPRGIQTRDPGALRQLTEGLMLSGLAMQFANSSRPASGAEHQFSHLWDMQHHTYQGATPLHGFKVGIATLAVAALYEYILTQPLQNLAIGDCCKTWPNQMGLEETIGSFFESSELRGVALKESRVKYVDSAALRQQLTNLPNIWPELRERLRGQLVPFVDLQRKLRSAGAPVEPEEIGLTREYLRDSFRQAYFIRRRFTVLDLAFRTSLLDQALDHIFGANGPWPIISPKSSTSAIINDKPRAGGAPGSHSPSLE